MAESSKYTFSIQGMTGELMTAVDAVVEEGKEIQHNIESVLLLS